MRFQRISILLLTLGLLLASPSVAVAQFPGINGRIALSSGTSDTSRSIVSFNENGGNEDELIPGAGQKNQWPAWSPGGTMLTYARDGAIFVANANGSNAHEIVPSKPWGMTPSWSPDGTKIVFASGGDIATVNLDGTGLTILTSSDHQDIRPKWSPDGDTIAFERLSVQTQAPRIALMDANGADPHTIFGGGRSESYPDWHPTKGTILFLRDYGASSGGARVMVARPDGTNEKLLSTSPMFAAQYSPDGKKIIGVSGTPLDRAISLMNADGSNRHLIRDAGRSQPDYGGPVWRPVPPT